LIKPIRITLDIRVTFAVLAKQVCPARSPVYQAFANRVSSYGLFPLAGSATNDGTASFVAVWTRQNLWRRGGFSLFTLQ
jgi:hypothetical protein